MRRKGRVSLTFSLIAPQRIHVAIHSVLDEMSSPEMQSTDSLQKPSLGHQCTVA
jgi:hypothetical protein